MYKVLHISELSTYTKRVLKAPVIRWLLVGIVLGTSSISPWTWWLAIVGLVLFILIIRQTQDLKFVLGGSLLVGIVQAFVVYTWFWSLYPLDWIGMSRPAGAGIIIGVWFLSSLALGIGRVFFGWYVHRVRQNNRALYLGVPFAWVMSELLGSLIFSLYILGPGVGITLEYSVSYIGYVLAEHGLLIRLAELGGVFILSATVAATAVYFYRLLTRTKPAIGKIVAIAALVFVTSFIPFTNPYQIDDYVVAALGTDYEAYVRLAPEEQRVRQDNLIQAVADTLSQGVDYVILPEDARLSSSFDTPEAVFNFLTSFTDKDVVLVDPAMEWLDDGTKVVVALVYDTKTNSVEKIYKELLTPGGEYLSYFNGGILRLLGFSEALDNFNRMYGYKPWPNKTPLPEGVPEILFCFEGQSSVALWQKARRSGVPFVAHVVSHSWFKDSKILRHELDQMLRVNSLFARTSVYQAANKSHSMRY